MLLPSGRTPDDAPLPGRPMSYCKTAVLQGQITALQDAAKRYPDLTRAGIRGWSFGGFLAVFAVPRRPAILRRRRGGSAGHCPAKLAVSLPMYQEELRMAIVKFGIAMSLDGFVAGPNQSTDHPFGEGVGESLHRWMFEQAEENAAEIAALNSAGAYIMGRNMFGPGRGEWDLEWTGWWGPEPPYHAPVFVLTHHAREPIMAAGGTTFTFVTDGIEAALNLAQEAAAGQDVAIAGGAATINSYLAAGLIDELTLHITPVVLGRGERLFDGLDQFALEPLEARHTKLVTHVRYRVIR